MIMKTFKTVCATCILVYSVISFITWDVVWLTDAGQVERAAFLILFMMAFAPVWMLLEWWCSQ